MNDAIEISGFFYTFRMLWPLEWHKLAKLKMLVRVQPVSLNHIKSAEKKKRDNLLILPDEIRKKIIENAIRAYPLECCGVLFGKIWKEEKVVWKAATVKNSANIKGQNVAFQIDPLEFIRIEEEAERDNLQIIGFYHSHPDCGAVLSKEDETYMIPDISYPIISVVQGKCEEIKCYIKKISGKTMPENIKPM